MAKGGHRRTSKHKKSYRRRDTTKEPRNMQRAMDRKKQSRKSKTLLRQMRGMKWNEDEYSEELEEELEDA